MNLAERGKARGLARLRFVMALPGGNCVEDDFMRTATLAPFSAVYSVQNLPAVSRSLRSLPEFSRGSHRPDEEEYVWRAPNSGPDSGKTKPVASVWLSGNLLTIECQSRPALKAMQVLIQTLAANQLTPVAQESQAFRA